MAQISPEPLSVGCVNRNDPGFKSFALPGAPGDHRRSPEILPGEVLASRVAAGKDQAGLPATDQGCSWGTFPW